jgi:hypothetical protein
MKALYLSSGVKENLPYVFSEDELNQMLKNVKGAYFDTTTDRGALRIETEGDPIYCDEEGQPLNEELDPGFWLDVEPFVRAIQRSGVYPEHACSGNVYIHLGPVPATGQADCYPSRVNLLTGRGAEPDG